MKFGGGEKKKGISYAIVIPNKLVKKYDLDKETYLMLEEDAEFDGKHIFYARKIDY